MSSNIGIKIANGEFYPIIEENSCVKKRLILTTVHDDQPSVQIDLFRSAENEMADAQYIGTLVVDHIRPKPKGEPSIEMVISSNNDGEIIADAIDMDSSAKGEHYVLTVSLKSLDETGKDITIPDIDLDTEEGKGEGLYRHAEKIREKKRFPLWLVIVIGLILILGLLAVWLFLFGGMDTVRSAFNRQETAVVQTAPAVPAVSEPAVTAPAAPAPATPAPAAPAAAEPAVTSPAQTVPEPVPVIQAPSQPPAPAPVVTRTRPVPPVASYNVPEVIPREGANYTIRWGDTLWDISAAFYRDPLLYPRIAQFNNIRNPDYIISGRTIRIPPRN